MAERLLDNRTRYNAGARAYEALVRFGSLGQFERFHRAVAAEIAERPGGVIVDLGCGPATLTPCLLPKVAPGGRIIGVDIADEMISRARAIAGMRGWSGTEFIRSDIDDFEAPSQVDAVVFCLSLSTMPNPERCLARALEWLAPGGRLVILDSIPERKRRLASWVMHRKAPLVGARPTGLPLEFASAQLDSVTIRRFHLGVYTLVAGRKPEARSTFEIRPARSDEAAALSLLATRSKAHWGYSQAQMAIFRSELTITPEEVEPQHAHVLESAGEVVGFYTLGHLDSGELELGHLFVAPEQLRRGFGEALLQHACRVAREAGFSRMQIQSDPNALGFYRRRGARLEGDVPSSIPGRSLPLLYLELPEPSP